MSCEGELRTSDGRKPANCRVLGEEGEEIELEAFVSGPFEFLGWQANPKLGLSCPCTAQPESKTCRVTLAEENVHCVAAFEKPRRASLGAEARSVGAASAVGAAATLKLGDVEISHAAGGAVPSPTEVVLNQDLLSKLSCSWSQAEARSILTNLTLVVGSEMFSCQPLTSAPFASMHDVTPNCAAKFKLALGRLQRLFEWQESLTRSEIAITCTAEFEALPKPVLGVTVDPKDCKRAKVVGGLPDGVSRIIARNLGGVQLSVTSSEKTETRNFESDRISFWQPIESGDVHHFKLALLWNGGAKTETEVDYSASCPISIRIDHGSANREKVSAIWSYSVETAGTSFENVGPWMMEPMDSFSAGSSQIVFNTRTTGARDGVIAKLSAEGSLRLAGTVTLKSGEVYPFDFITSSAGSFTRDISGTGLSIKLTR